MDGKLEYDNKFVEAREDSPEPLEAAEQSLDCVSLFVQLQVVFQNGQPISLGWYDRLHAKVKGQPPCFVAFIGLVHDDRRPFPSAIVQVFQQLPPFRGTTGLAGRQSKRYGAIGSRCNDVNLGSPPSPVSVTLPRLCSGTSSPIMRTFPSATATLSEPISLAPPL